MNATPNPYAAPRAHVSDPALLQDAGSALPTLIVIHSLWACLILFATVVELQAEAIGSGVAVGLAAFIALYAFAIYQIARGRIWAWWFCWLPTLGFLVMGFLAALGAISNRPDRALLVEAVALGLATSAMAALILQLRVRPGREYGE